MSLAKLSNCISKGTEDKIVQAINIIITFYFIFMKLLKFNVCCILALFLSPHYWKMHCWCKSTLTVLCQCVLNFKIFLDVHFNRRKM